MLVWENLDEERRAGVKALCDGGGGRDCGDLVVYSSRTRLHHLRL